MATAGGWLTRYRPRKVRNSIYRYRKIHIDYRSKFLYRFISPVSIIYGNTKNMELISWQPFYWTISRQACKPKMAATKSCEPSTFDRCTPIGQWLASDSFVTCCKTWQTLFLTENVWYSGQGWSVHSMIWPISITKLMWLPLQHSCTLKSALTWNQIKIVLCKKRNALWCTPPQLPILHRALDAKLFQMLNN